jgi:hypothetical protein
MEMLLPIVGFQPNLLQSQLNLLLTAIAAKSCGIFVTFFFLFVNLLLCVVGSCAMSLRRYEWRVCGRGKTTSKPSIHVVPSYNLRRCSGNLKKNLQADEKSKLARLKG